MVTKLVKRFVAECGKAYWSKSSCASHELNCRCWTNPKFKTCKTCKFGKQEWDSNGMEHEPQNLQTWRQWQCSNPKMLDGYFTPAHEKASDLCINCFVWENKKAKTLSPESTTPQL